MSHTKTLVRRSIFLVLIFSWAPIANDFTAADPVDIFRTAERSVLKVKVRSQGGGSGVVIQPQWVATVCHIFLGDNGTIKYREGITVQQFHDADGVYHQAGTQTVKAEFGWQVGTPDLCILYVEELSYEPAAVPVDFGTGMGELNRGDRLCMVGNAGDLGLSISCGVGQPQCLSEACKPGEWIIQTDALTTLGSSGGAVFLQKNGNLIGILRGTSMQIINRVNPEGTGGIPEHGHGFAIALPVEWVKDDWPEDPLSRMRKSQD